MPEAELCPPLVTLQADAPLLASLSLRVTHHIDVPDDAECPGSATFPPSVEFTPLQHLTLRLSACLNGVSVPAVDLEKSALLSRLILFLRRNMAHLGITQVLPGAIANDKVNVLLSTGIQRGMQDEGYILQGFHVHISFDSEAKNAEGFHPFTPFLTLPYVGLIDRTCISLVKHHFIGPYPRIFSRYHEVNNSLLFGPVADKHQLHNVLRGLCRSISKSLRKIANRSSTLSFTAAYAQAVQDLEQCSCVAIANTGQEADHSEGKDQLIKQREAATAWSLEELFRRRYLPVVRDEWDIRNTGFVGEDDVGLPQMEEDVRDARESMLRGVECRLSEPLLV